MFSWSPEENKILIALGGAIANAQELNLPDLNESFQMHIDASYVGILAVLTQKKRLVRIFSSELAETQMNYSTQKRGIRNS